MSGVSGGLTGEQSEIRQLAKAYAEGRVSLQQYRQLRQQLLQRLAEDVESTLPLDRIPRLD